MPNLQRCRLRTTQLQRSRTLHQLQRRRNPPAMKFYLGTDRLNWLHRDDLQDIPLFVSHRGLKNKKHFKPATMSWALDSGGFTELTLHGQWTTTPQSYIAHVQRYKNEIGKLEWASPQDWMCEPHMLKRTGLTIREHQQLTVRSVLDLRTLSPQLPIIPVLQGWTRDDYLTHVEMYAKAGIALENETIVGLGSICRRQATWQAAEIAMALQPLKLHAFGAKQDAIGMYGQFLTSCDSMAWSYGGRMNPDPQCAKRSCSHCLHYALQWRKKALQPRKLTLWGTYER